MLHDPHAEARLAHLMSRLGDRYEFQSRLGQGGAGTVYEVLNRALGRREALKVLSESLGGDGAARFVNEAKISASLDHPGIVKIHDVGQVDGRPWFSMQLVEGPTLSGLMEAGRRFDDEDLARLAIPLLEALAFSHAHGVIHRDIKPANILIGPHGRPILTDFGVAKTEENPLHTLTGHLLGTPAYASPEQALAEPVDARTDQYSLGITLYRVLAGRLPFTADQAIQTLVLRLKQDPEPLSLHRPDLDPGVTAVIMRALARDREARWPDATAMREALVAACEAVGLDWARPLEGLGAFRLARQPLPITGDSHLELTTDLPSGIDATTLPAPSHPPRPSRRSWVPILATLAGLGALSLWIRWPRAVPLQQGKPALVATPPRADGPAPAPPAADPVPREPKPIPQPQAKPVELLRRPVSYPLLLETSPVALRAGSPCAGTRVNVSITVGEDGLAKACRVLGSVPPECAAAAREAALRFRFKPALDAQGRPVEAPLATEVVLPESP